MSSLNQLVLESELQYPGIIGKVNAAMYKREDLLKEIGNVVVPLGFTITGTQRAQIMNTQDFLKLGIYVGVKIHRGVYSDLLGGVPYVIEPILKEISLSNGIQPTLYNDFNNELSRLITFGVDDGLTDLTDLAISVLTVLLVRVMQIQANHETYNLVVVDFLSKEKFIQAKKTEFMDRFFCGENLDKLPPMVMVSDDVTPTAIAISLEIHGVKSELVTSLYNDNPMLFKYVCNELSTTIFKCGQFDKSAFPYSKEMKQWFVFNEYNVAPLMMCLAGDHCSELEKAQQHYLLLCSQAIYNHCQMFDDSATIKMLLAKFASNLHSGIKNDIIMKSWIGEDL